MRSSSWFRNPSTLLVSIAFLLFPVFSQAVPGFSRRYNVKCYACHTIPPVLNQAGYMFKRLGFHFPPGYEPGSPGMRMSEIVKSEPPWTIESTASFAVADVSYSSTRTTEEGGASSSSSTFTLAAWNAYWAGGIPDTNFWYYSEFDIVAGGEVAPDISNANFGYSGGSANSSWYLKAGRSHLSVGEGTRAAGVYSTLPDSALLFETASPTNYVLDQSPLGVGAGYTWASPGYKNILAASVEVTNGLNDDGSEILGSSPKNSKDIWAEVDWWYAPESGISFVNYYGKKFQTQNLGADNEFQYYPVIRRQGVFANCMLPFKIDLLGGYLRSRDDWSDPATGTPGRFEGNDFYVEATYYIRTGTALAGRYDRLDQKVSFGPGRQGNRNWEVGFEQALTKSGNIVARVGYSDQAGRDPVAAAGSTGKSVMTDIAFNF